MKYVFDHNYWRSSLPAVPQVSAVYRIRNCINGKAYVGSARNVRARWHSHLSYLFEGRGSGQPILARAWKKYGAASFEFEIVELCDVPELLATEQRWMAHAGYNVRKVAHSNLGLRFPPRSEELRRRIGLASGAARKGKPNGRKNKFKQTPEARARMSATKRTLFRKIEYDGQRMCLSDWAERIGITTRALGNRLRRGWPLSRALTERSRGY